MNDFSSWSQRTCAPMNVGETERIGSAIAGGVLLLCAVRPRFLPGAVWALGGAAVGVGLLARAVSGRCAVYDRLNISTAEDNHPGSLAHVEPVRSRADHYGEAPPMANPLAASPANPPDGVDEASWDSFPASDPPSSIVSGVGAPPPV